MGKPWVIKIQIKRYESSSVLTGNNKLLLVLNEKTAQIF